MEMCLDFVEWLGPDTSFSVLVLLDDPADIIRVSAVSQSWRRFVIANRICRSLCFRMCPEVSHVKRVVETCSAQTAEAGSNSCTQWKNLEIEHRVYSYLSHSIVSVAGKSDCILKAIHASSTDNFPDESIENTLVPSGQVDLRSSYWSSEGQKDPDVPETLTYMLLSTLCVVNEIIIQPFEAYFQRGNPIYSAKAVRFRMGHCRLPLITSTDMNGGVSATDNYEWTYISPEFCMLQENTLQSFKLPRPALCVGGILQIELTGRVQVQEMDGLYYICVCYVEALGHPLRPILDVDFVGARREMVLRWQPEAGGRSLSAASDERHSSIWRVVREPIRHAQHAWHYPILINTLLGAIATDSDSDD